MGGGGLCAILDSTTIGEIAVPSKSLPYLICGEISASDLQSNIEVHSE